ncbi:unnamed protein product, partial [Mesorhabditis belari]|uniref:protein-serine/threonine phosphatase n=1 Tax=Mesorhabditis belari TaxID=2138241 RepID=A0AAF3EGE8_9BILA
MRSLARRRNVFLNSRSTFSEQFDSLKDPAFYLANLVIAPGRTPSVAEIMRMGLIGRRKPAGDKLLLPPLQRRDVHKKCLIIDLDETLVHSSFKPVKNPDFVIPVEIDGVIHQVYVLKRPFVDEFLEHVGDKFECVLFTASLAKYADPVADLLDKRGVFRTRLFREACVFHKGNYVKDLARLGRDLNKVLIMDNSPASYAFHPENAIAVQTWFDDPHDSELLEVLPLLDRLVDVDSVYTMLRQSESPEPRSDRSSS